jgi:hypothetical protein
MNAKLTVRPRISDMYTGINSFNQLRNNIVKDEKDDLFTDSYRLSSVECSYTGLMKLGRQKCIHRVIHKF